MKDRDIDAYVAQFKELAWMAGYRLDEPQTIDTFIVGLPLNLYLKTFELDCSGMTPRYAELADKDNGLDELPGRTSQAKRGDKSRAEPTVTVEVSVTQGLFIQESRRKVSHTVVG